MANTVNVTLVEGGQRNVTLHVYLQSDGATGDLVKYELFSPVTLGLPPKPIFNLRQIDYNLAGFDGVLSFDSGMVTPNSKIVLVEGANNPINLDYMGGIPDNSGIDGTGKLLLSTFGFNSTTDVGFIVLRMIIR